MVHKRLRVLRVALGLLMLAALGIGVVSALDPPTITGITPNAGYAGTVVSAEITGTNFVDGMQVRLMQDAWATIDAVDEIVIPYPVGDKIHFQFAIPPATSVYSDAYGDYTVQVLGPNGWVSGPTFSVRLKPQIEGVAPDLVPCTGGTYFGIYWLYLDPEEYPGIDKEDLGAVYGYDLPGTTEITFTNGGTTITATPKGIFEDDQVLPIDVTVPASAPSGWYAVTLTNGNLPSVTKEGVMYKAPCGVTITGISPPSGARSSTVIATITGTGFVSGMPVKLVSSTGTSTITATGVTVLSPTELRCTFTIPSDTDWTGQVGPYTLWVGATSKASAFTVTGNTPTITGASPATVPCTGGTYTGYVYGTDFYPGAQVQIATSAGTTIMPTDEEVLSGPTQIRYTLSVPATAASGYYTLTVTNPDQAIATKTNALYKTPCAMTLTSISPASGVRGATVAATITGTGFTTGTSVQLSSSTGTANIAATDVTAFSSTQLRCTFAIPSTAPAGSYALLVRARGATTWVSKTHAFTVTTAPTVIAVPPSTVPPTDTDGDGMFDDVNGNGRPDFADVVLYFNSIAWIPGHQPMPAFDYNGNSRIDFADVVWLFNHL